MRKFEVHVPHTLSAEEVRTRLDRAKTKLEEDYGATCTWQSPTQMRVHRKGLDAQVHVRDDKLDVHVELGLLVAPMAGALREGIVKRLTSLLA